MASLVAIVILIIGIDINYHFTAVAQVSYCFVAFPTNVSSLIFTYSLVPLVILIIGIDTNYHLIAVAQVSYWFVALPTNIMSSVIFT